MSGGPERPGRSAARTARPGAVTRFSLLGALWALALALLLEPALVQAFALDADVALAAGAALTSAAVATLARERTAWAVPALTLGLVVVVVLALAKPLRLSACEGEWCVADDVRGWSPWLWLAVPASWAAGAALTAGARAALRRLFHD